MHGLQGLGLCGYDLFALQSANLSKEPPNPYRFVPLFRIFLLQKRLPKLIGDSGL
uniref:Uncharacterized protein n=1 Tax=Echinococcus granulosus TaxID=6210 RepID=A0A068WYF7_ECHGR|nr:hypothetical protein EgrG_000396100 [Echinococcus granulosus]